jgi:hypothetical protein
MADPWQIEKLLTAAIRRSLEDAERLSSADLEHDLTTSYTHEVLHISGGRLWQR